MNNQYRILLDREGAGSREFSLGEAGMRPFCQLHPVMPYGTMELIHEVDTTWTKKQAKS